jgi:MFS family permease
MAASHPGPRSLNPIFPITLIVLLNHISMGGSRILVSLFALKLGATPLAIGVLVSLYSAIPLVLAVYSGRLADRLGFLVPMVIGSVILVVAMIVPFAWPAMPALYLSAALAGAGFVFFNNSVQALVGAISQVESRAFNFSTLAMGYSISSLVGPPFVGYSIEYFGHPRTYLWLAFIVIASIGAILWQLRVIRGARVEAAGDGERSAVDLLKDRRLFRMFLASGVCVTGWDLFTFYMPIYGKSVHLAESTIGNIIGAFGAATFVVRLVIPRLSRRFGEHGLLAGALLVGASAFLAFPFFSNVWVLAALAFVMGLGLGCGQPLTMLLTYSYSPAGRAGEANGLRQMANNITHIFVPVFFGALGSAFGMVPAFWTNAVFLAGGAWLSRR